MYKLFVILFFIGISSSDSQLLERLIFRKHYSQLTTLLFQTNLTPHLVTEGVLVPLDVGDISSAATAAKKAELVLLKIAGSLDAHFPNSFHKLIKVMKTYGNDDLKQLAIIMENEGYAAKDAITGKLIYGGYRRLYVILVLVCILYEQKFWHGIKLGGLVDAYKITKLKPCHNHY